MYEGFEEFVKLLQELVRRPRRGETPPRQRGADRRWGLPLLCLVRPEGAAGVLQDIRVYLRNSRPAPIPHALYEFPPDAAAESAAAPETPREPVTYADLDHVSTALFDIAKQLLAGPRQKSGRIGFRRFELVRWLMKQRLDPEQMSHDVELSRLIEGFEAGRRRRNPPPESLQQELPWFARLTMWLLPPLWFRLRLRAGARYRWFLRQPFLAPNDPGTFLGFAQRITGWLGDQDGRKTDGESTEELLGLLVNAFLEDVRAAYRRRPRGARRTAYPVVLLDRITRRNGGYRLLETVNRVRNETGLFDPVLFVSASRKVPPDAYPPGSTPRNLWKMTRSDAAYRSWRDAFRRASRERQDAAWYLPVSVAIAEDHDPAVTPSADTLELLPPPLWSRAAVLPTAAVLVVALVAGGLLWLDWVREESERAWQDRHCGLERTAPFADYLLTVDGECIGVSAEPVPVFHSTAGLREVQDVITRQNAEAERLRGENSRRPFVSVAYVSEMSAASGIQPAEIERLQGIAARQRRQLDGTDIDPLVRIVFVNAGREMRHGARAAAMLAKLAAEDRTIVGVVGLAVSSRATVETIKAIGRAGLPMVAAPLTADGIERESQLYHQIAPQNLREAQVAARYARAQLGVTGTVTVVTSGDEEDLYAATLSADAREEFKRAGFTVTQRVYTPSPELGTHAQPTPRDVGQQLCGLDGLVFYTGRPPDFEQLLDGINQTCGSDPPLILAGDDISRYVANADQREQFPLIPFDYFALAPGGQTCFSGGDLNNTLRVLFPERCASTRDFLTDDAPTAYDALTAIVVAVHQLRGTAINPGAVWHKISEITGRNRIDGASGVIDFGRDGAQVPLDKFVAIMRVDGHGPPRTQATCGHYRGQVRAPWCP
ncbi:ABC transporter substrate-binding protein [Actinophytocola glycyrrhizae]|uniref:ABC transporter substrate-binding protein n=1 Tax=Actinophytocola glycyrrhizae TaxID=2044873 RepID=A0ABV9SE79_9PSEU